MNNVKNLSNMTSLFKEIYADSLKNLFSDFQWEKNKFYYDPQVFMRQNPFMGIINNQKAPYTEKVNKKTLILELTDV